VYCEFGDDAAYFALTCCDPCTVYGEVGDVSTAIEIEKIAEKEGSGKKLVRVGHCKA
jgi:hypothetical protein